MTYKQAHIIGEHCDGYIKCTYVMLHSPELGALYSVQKGFLHSNSAKDEFNQSVSAVNTDEELFINQDLPLCISEGESPHDSRYAIVRLTEAGKNAIIKKMSGRLVTKYTVWRIWDAVDPNKGGMVGAKEKIYEGGQNPKYMSFPYSMYYHYETEKKQIISPKYQELIDGLKTDALFEVKKAAMDWIPTDVQNLTIVTEQNTEVVAIKQLMEIGKQKLNRAKALLVAAGATVIL